MMDNSDRPAAKIRERRVLLGIGIILAGLLCCYLIGMLGFVALIFSFAIRQDNPFQIRQTPTPIPLINVNPGTPLGKFSFGFDGVNSACRVNTPVDEFSQEDLLRNEDLYFSASFRAEQAGQSISWALYDADGHPIDEEKNRTLELGSDLDHCAQAMVFINTRTAPGTYVLEVMYVDKLVYRQVIQITPSNLSAIPRPNRGPLGKFTLGWASVDTETCRASDQATRVYTLAEVKGDPWFYVMSPFQLPDIGKKVYLSLYSSNGKAVFSREELAVEDDIDLCFWEGFSMEDSPAGKYTLVMEDEQYHQWYKTEFELK